MLVFVICVWLGPPFYQWLMKIGNPLLQVYFKICQRVQYGTSLSSAGQLSMQRYQNRILVGSETEFGVVRTENSF